MEETITKSYAGSREFALDFPQMVEAGWIASSTTTCEHGLSHKLMERLRPRKNNQRPEPKVVVVYRRNEPAAKETAVH
jgi:hypothetical protein